MNGFCVCVCVCVCVGERESSWGAAGVLEPEWIMCLHNYLSSTSSGGLTLFLRESFCLLFRISQEMEWARKVAAYIYTCMYMYVCGCAFAREHKAVITKSECRIVCMASRWCVALIDRDRNQ